MYALRKQQKVLRASTVIIAEEYQQRRRCFVYVVRLLCRGGCALAPSTVIHVARTRCFGEMSSFTHRQPLTPARASCVPGSPAVASLDDPNNEGEADSLRKKQKKASD